MSEFYVTVTKKIKRTISQTEARKEIELLRLIELVEIRMDHILHAIDISGRYKISYWDALIVACAIEANCPIIYSEDLSLGQQYEATIVLNPYI